MTHSSRLRTTLFGLSTALWASSSLAQTSTSTSTSTTGLTQTDFLLFLQRKDGDSWNNLSTNDAVTYLNQARCQCATPLRVVVQMVSASRYKLSGLTATWTNARLYVGNGCAQVNTAVIPPRPQCDSGQIGSTLNGLSALSANGSWVVETTVDKLFSAVGVDCDQTLVTTIWLWIDTTGTGYPDSGVTGSSAPNLGIKLDGTPPEAPSGIIVEGGDKALVVSWTPGSVPDWPDLAGYLAFCMRENDLQVFNPSYYSTQYLTGQILCSAGSPAPSSAGPISSAAGITTAVEVGAPQPFQDLDPSYLCSGLLPPTQTSVRLGTLQNGIPYTVGVAAVDNDGNASPIQSGFVQVPSATGGVEVPVSTGGSEVPPAAGGTTAGLGKSGCACRLAGADCGAVPWGAMLALGAASRPWRRCRKGA